MQGAVWRCWFGSLAGRGRCSLPGVPTTGEENMGKNTKFILIAKTMQAFAYLFLLMSNAASLSAWGLCPVGLSSTGTLKTNNVPTHPPLFFKFTFGEKKVSICLCARAD